MLVFDLFEMEKPATKRGINSSSIHWGHPSRENKLLATVISGAALD